MVYSTASSQAEIAVIGVGSFPVIVNAPVLDDHVGFVEPADLAAVAEFLTESAVERSAPRDPLRVLP